jgi:hypothetical protein
VDVPAKVSLDGDSWFCVRRGFQALLVEDEKGFRQVFGTAEEASSYYCVMIRIRWVPVLTGEHF